MKKLKNGRTISLIKSNCYVGILVPSHDHCDVINLINFSIQSLESIALNQLIPHKTRCRNQSTYYIIYAEKILTYFVFLCYTNHANNFLLIQLMYKYILINICIVVIGHRWNNGVHDNVIRKCLTQKQRIWKPITFKHLIALQAFCFSQIPSTNHV